MNEIRKIFFKTGNVFLITVGIALSQGQLRIAILRKKKSKILIQELSTFTDSPESVKQLYNHIFALYKKNFTIATFLEAKDVILRRLSLPLIEKRKILATLPFQIESLITIPENSIVSIAIDSIFQKRSLLGVFVTSHALLRKHIEFLETKGIGTNYVGSAISNLFRFITWILPQQKKGVVIYVGFQEMICLFYQENLLESAQSFSVDPLFFKKNLEKYQVFLNQKGWETNCPYMLIEENPSGIDNIVKEVFGTNQLFLENSSHQQYALAIGAALESLAEDSKQINFSQKAFTTKKTKQRFLQKIYYYLLGCTALTVISLIGVQMYIHRKQTALFTHISSFLPQELQKTYPKSIQEWQHSLLSWRTILEQKKFPFPMLPTVPKVSDVLAWISTHPAFIDPQGKLKEGMDILSIHYQMLHYPTIDKKNTPYEAQVEIEFTASIPKLAREFHEALLKENQIVNTKKPIQWQAQGNKYRAAFILKPLN